MTATKRDDGLYDLHLGDHCFTALTWDDVVALMEKFYEYENSEEMNNG